MEIAHLIRNADKVKSTLKEVGDTVVTERECKIHIPKHYLDGKLGSVEGNVKVIVGEQINLSQAWNACYEKSTGNIVWRGADDILFRTKDWDEMVLNRFNSTIVYIQKDKL